MKPGCCQCVALGMIRRSTSARIVGEGLGSLGRVLREQRAERSGLDRGQHGLRFDRLEVVGDPVDHGVRRRAERLRVHVGQALDLLGVEARLPHVAHPASLPAMSRGSLWSGCRPAYGATDVPTSTGS